MSVIVNLQGITIDSSLWRRKGGMVHFKIGQDHIASIAEHELPIAIDFCDLPPADGRWRKCAHSLKLELTQL